MTCIASLSSLRHAALHARSRKVLIPLT